MDFMQSDPNLYLKKAMLPTAIQGDDNHMQIPLSSTFPSVLPSERKNLGPFNTVEFQPSEICPQNFIIFDHTDNRSQIIFHPAIAKKLSGPTASMCSKYIQKNVCINDEHYEDREISSPSMEDLDDIDAFLSSEDQDHEDLDGSEDEEISTARSHLNYESTYPDSSFSYSSKPRKNRSFNPVHESSSSGSRCDSDMKQLKVKKMMRKLREILPGGNQMTTVTILDEAVKYLKSLKDEVQKGGNQMASGALRTKA